MSASFQKLATVTAGTKRSPPIVSGKRGVPTTNLSGLKVLPLDPIDPDLRIRLELDTPHEVLQTQIEFGPDIQKGDILTVGSDEYTIRAVGDWTWRPAGTDILTLILEALET